MSTDLAAGKRNNRKKAKALNTSLGVQLLLLLDVWMRLMLWGTALTVTLLVIARNQSVRAVSWDSLHTFKGAWDFAQLMTVFIMLFNLSYLLELMVVRAILPRPKRGIYKFRGIPDINLLFSCLSGILTKARYQAPFPAFLVQQFANIQPLRWLLGEAGIGPRTKTSFFVDASLMDPWALTIGKNVNIGYGTTITAHIQEFDYVMIDPVIIEDNVMIGAHSAISSGVHIKRGAYLEPYSVVKPGEVIGESELWAGRPAKKKGYYRASGGTNGNGADVAEREDPAVASQ